jgi:hypothetical protein
MSTTAPKSVTTPILVQLSEPEFETFILPHLSMPKRGPKCKLGYHRVFNLILWVLYTGMQWKCTVYKVRLRRTTSLRAGLLLAVGSFDRLTQRAWLLAASRPAWERLSAAGRGLLSATQPQAGPARQPSCGRRAAGRAHGQPPGAG